VKELIKTEKLSKYFEVGDETIRALQEVSISINQGEFVAIKGASGSGKSTLMYILGLLDSPSSGNYFLNGQNTSLLSENQRARLRNEFVGFVFQSFHLLPHASALRNVSMPLVYAGSYSKNLTNSAIQSKALNALARVGLSDRVQHKPSELSGGQRQRVAIARAIVNNPKLIFADEPTGNLDSQKGQQILEIFRELNSEGATIILVTHDLSVANSAERIIEISDGRVLSDSSRMRSNVLA
jgi:ABC-type lipoprotein export system ATPase subunit